MAVGILTDDGNAVQRSDGADVVGGGNGTTNRRLLLLGAVLDSLASEVGGTALAGLKANHHLSISVCPDMIKDGRGVCLLSYMIGALASRAASRAATTVLEEVTLTAGMAKPFSRAYVKSFSTSSPVPHSQSQILRSRRELSYRR